MTLSELQDTSAREVARSHSSCILSFDLIGQHQNKRFYVTEIVLPLGFADAIFRREEATTGNTSAVRRLITNGRTVAFDFLSPYMYSCEYKDMYENTS